MGSLDLFAPAPTAATARDGEVSPTVAGAKNCGTCGNGTPQACGIVCAHGKPYTYLPERTKCEFTPSRWKPIDAKVQAKREAQAGIDQAAAAAERAHAGWGDEAFEFVRYYAKMNVGKKFVGRDIVLASKQSRLPEPPNDKAFGAVIQRAVREGVIQKTGAFVPDPNRHGNPVPEYTA